MRSYIMLHDSKIEPSVLAGTIVYDTAKYDYGLARDDTYFTGVEHMSVSLNPDGDYPFFTVPVMHVQELKTNFPFHQYPHQRGLEETKLFERTKLTIKTHYSFNPEVLVQENGVEILAREINSAFDKINYGHYEFLEDEKEDAPRSNQPKVNVKDFVKGIK